MLKYIFLLFIVTILMLSCKSESSQITVKTGFREMKGNLIAHHVVDNIDSLSGQEIIELQDDNGLTIWFSRFIHKDVCMTGQCKMLSLWLYWDGTGNYLGIELPENEPLTKSDHSEFDKYDYEKLETILADTLSIFGFINFDELVEESELDSSYETDGITAATSVGLQDVGVKNAVYTCYTLWHTVYGFTRSVIKEILYQRIDSEYLTFLFDSNELSYQSFAIECISKNQEYHNEFYPRIIELIKSEDIFLSERAMNYFTSVNINDVAIQKELVKILSELNPENQNKLLLKLSESNIIDISVLIDLLELLVSQKIDISTITNIYTLIKPEHLSVSEVLQIIQLLGNHENSYIRNITGKLLNTGG